MDSLAKHLAYFETLTARKADRVAGANYLSNHPDQWHEIFLFALNPKGDRIHVLICWCVELFVVANPTVLTPHFDVFLKGIATITNESMRRSLSKILFYYITKKRVSITKKQIDDSITQAFDWLIEPAQVATLNFSLKILQCFQEERPWVKEELRALVQQQLPTASPGYRAAAREILK